MLTCLGGQKQLMKLLEVLTAEQFNWELLEEFDQKLKLSIYQFTLGSKHKI